MRYINLYHKIKAFITHTIKSKFIRNVTIVASGAVAAQVISMIFSPLITRIYGPDGFGLLGIFNSLFAMLIPIAALAYPIAIVLPKDDNEAEGLAKLSIYIAFVMASFVSITFLFVGEQLLSLLGAVAITPFVMLIPVSMFFSAYSQVAQHLLIRKNQFSLKAKITIYHTLLFNSAKVGIGWFYPFGAVLVILTAMCNVLSASMFWVGIRISKNIYSLKERGKSPLSLRALAKKYYDFPLYRAPQAFISALSESLPVLILASFFGPASAGFYIICKTVLTIPSRLIGMSVGDVFYPRITEAVYNKENLSRLILKATLSLAVVGFLPFLIILIFGPQLFSFVFGSEWVIAGEYSRWLTFGMFFIFINRPSVVSIAVLGLQGYLLVYEIINMMVIVVALFIGGFVFKNDVIAVALFSISSTLLDFLLITMTVVKAKAAQRRI